MNSILMHPIEGGPIMWMSSTMVGNKHMGNWTLANWRVQKRSMKEVALVGTRGWKDDNDLNVVKKPKFKCIKTMNKI